MSDTAEILEQAQRWRAAGQGVALVGEAQGVIADGKPRLLDFGITDDQAWEVGLACGGKVEIFVERVE
jgi:xanthine/CO dehydrogenase XdhC/CoxF family maturation factor